MTCFYPFFVFVSSFDMQRIAIMTQENGSWLRTRGPGMDGGIGGWRSYKQVSLMIVKRFLFFSFSTEKGRAELG